MKSVLVVGDVILDEYVYVKAERKAQEAPIMVWDEISREIRLGGAANVAHNLKSFGKEEIDVTLVGICSDRRVKSLCAEKGIGTLFIPSETMVKTRYVEDQKIIFRSDNFKRFSIMGQMSPYLEKNDFDAVLVSDYDKGTISTAVLQSIRNEKCTKFVDSKRKDLRMFEGFDVLKLNEQEYSAQVSNGLYDSCESFFKFCVVTKGKNGSELRQFDHILSKEKKNVVHSETFPVGSVKAVDVTGCGDTHTAAMLYSYITTRDIRMAIKFANAAAREKVQMFGTNVPDLLKED